MVLVVDAESEVRDVLRDILEHEGYRVVTVESALVALEEAQQQSFDVLVADGELPDMSGLVLVYKFRELNPRIVPILVTAYPSPETKAIADDYGVHDYIVKPIDKVKFCKVIATALERKRLTEAVAENKRGRARNQLILSELLTVLKSSEIFKTLSDHELQNISTLCQERSYEAGEIIYDQGKRAEKLYVIQEGAIALVGSVKKEGTERFFTFEVLRQGGVLGWTALIEPHVHTASAVCRSPAKVLAMDGTELKFMLAREPAGLEVMQRLAILLGHRLRASYRALEAKVQNQCADSENSTSLQS